MFTNRFLQVPIVILNRQQRDAGLDESDCEQYTATLRLLPLQVESYRQCIVDDSGVEFSNKNATHTMITMKSGDEHIIEIAIEEFERLLNTFD